jgi:hypothetical protein
MGWEVNATPLPLYPRQRLGTHYIGGWVGPRVFLENLPSPTGTRSLDCPVRSESLYRLSYPGPRRRYKRTYLSLTVRSTLFSNVPKKARKCGNDETTKCGRKVMRLAMLCTNRQCCCLPLHMAVRLIPVVDSVQV